MKKKKIKQLQTSSQFSKIRTNVDRKKKKNWFNFGALCFACVTQRYLFTYKTHRYNVNCVIESFLLSYRRLFFAQSIICTLFPSVAHVCHLCVHKLAHFYILLAQMHNSKIWTCAISNIWSNPKFSVNSNSC